MIKDQRPDQYTYQVSVYLPSISILSFWHTDTYSVFFILNTDTDTSVFENHTGY